MAGATIRASDLLKALVRLAPDQAETVMFCARTTNLQMPEFCRMIRAEIGGTLLFDAVMVLRGGSEEASREPLDTVALFEHCVRCRAPTCSRQDCLELRGLLSTMKAHAQACPLNDCRTCSQWKMVRDKMIRARAVVAKAPRPPLPPTHAVEPAASVGGSAAAATLLMLARSALSDLPVTSPGNSRANSPMSSPGNSPPCSPRRKRAKANPRSKLDSHARPQRQPDCRHHPSTIKGRAP